MRGAAAAPECTLATFGPIDVELCWILCQEVLQANVGALEVRTGTRRQGNAQHTEKQQLFPGLLHVFPALLEHPLRHLGLGQIAILVPTLHNRVVDKLLVSSHQTAALKLTTEIAARHHFHISIAHAFLVQLLPAQLGNFRVHEPDAGEA